MGEIIVTVEQDDDGTYLVTDRFSTVYGEGITTELAISDYWASLTNYYHILMANVTENQENKMALRRLRKRLVKRPQ